MKKQIIKEGLLGVFYFENIKKKKFKYQNQKQ